MEKHFTEEDKNKFIDFLNMVAKHAEFKLSTNQVILYFKLLSHMQQVILPKLNDHIFEIKKIVQTNKED